MKKASLYYKSFKHEIRELISHSPFFVEWISQFSSWKRFLVHSDSRICIEGYPRSANTYAVAAFQVSQNDYTSHIGRHSHLSGQVLRAHKLGVPTVVLIRNPLDAIASLKIFSPYLTLDQCVRFYTKFYLEVENVLEDIVVVEFSSVTENFNDLIEKLNRKYGMSLRSVSHDEEFDEIVFKQVGAMDMEYSNSSSINPERVARPNEIRAKHNAEIKIFLKGAKYRQKLEELDKLYFRVLESL